MNLKSKNVDNARRVTLRPTATKVDSNVLPILAGANGRAVPHAHIFDAHPPPPLDEIVLVRHELRRRNPHGIRSEAMTIRSGAIIFGLIFAAIACVYWFIPAGSLPAFVPGFQPGSTGIHVKHGLASLAVAVVCFIVAWFAGKSSG